MLSGGSHYADYCKPLLHRIQCFSSLQLNGSAFTLMIVQCSALQLLSIVVVAVYCLRILSTLLSVMWTKLLILCSSVDALHTGAVLILLYNTRHCKTLHYVHYEVQFRGWISECMPVQLAVPPPLCFAQGRHCRDESPPPPNP